jgi:nitroreductase
MTDIAPDRRTALAAAADSARRAPSIHNTQPWRWRVLEETLELYADRSRQLPELDPDGHLQMLSCGAALQHASLALAAQGWRVDVDRVLDGDLLARLQAGEHVGADAQAMRLLRASEIRHSDRRPGVDEPIAADALQAVVEAAAANQARFFVVPAERVVELAVAVEHAEAAEAADPGQRAELARWVGGARTTATGVPDSAIPAKAPQTTVPEREFGRQGDLPVGTGHAASAVFGILYGDSDTPEQWLRAGEALSAAWLAATDHGLTLLPFSAPVEVVATREALRRLIGGIGHPYLAVRLGVADPGHAGPPGTPRLSAEQVIEIVD